MLSNSKRVRVWERNPSGLGRSVGLELYFAKVSLWKTLFEIFGLFSQGWGSTFPSLPSKNRLRRYLTDTIHFHLLHHSLQFSHADKLGATMHQQTCHSVFLNSWIGFFSFWGKRLVITMLSVSQVPFRQWKGQNVLYRDIWSSFPLH